MKIGVFSETAAKWYGSSYWTKEDGTEVEITWIGNEGADIENNYQWADKVIVGPVVAHSRAGRMGLINSSWGGVD